MEKSFEEWSTMLGAIVAELKVCEGCGGLWLRTTAHGAYCRKCSIGKIPAPTSAAPPTPPEETL